MKALLVRTTHEELERFLRGSSKIATHWDVSSNDPAFDEHVESLPLSIEDLMAAIQCYAPDSDEVYVFSDEEEALEIAAKSDLDALPTVKGEALQAYVIRCVRGSDYLWIACSKEQASNGDYITILPGKELE